MSRSTRKAFRFEPDDEFVLTQVGQRCWLVACNGRLIAGALLSSLRSAIEYATALAEGSGQRRFHLRVLAVSD